MAGGIGPINLNPAALAYEERPGSRIGTTTYTKPMRNAPRSSGAVTENFSTFLEAQLRDVNTVHKEADAAVAAMATGRSHNIHEMMIALDRADIALRMTTKVRNKAVEAYQEIMRMPI